MKQIFFLLSFLLLGLISFSQTEIDSPKESSLKNKKPKYDHRKFRSIGVMYGSTLGLESLSPAWTSYVDFGKWGIDYGQSAFLKTLDYTPYLQGNVNKLTPGGSTRNIGVFIKDEGGMFWGFGAQIVNLISVENKRIGNIDMPMVVQDKIVRPYGSIGYIGKLNEAFVFRCAALVSKFPNIQAGIGIKL